MNLDKTQLAKILDVKCDCTVQELTGHINTLAVHFGGNTFSEEEVIRVLREIENDDNQDALLVRARPFPDYPIEMEQPWCVIKTRLNSKFEPVEYYRVPG